MIVSFKSNPSLRWTVASDTLQWATVTSAVHQSRESNKYHEVTHQYVTVEIPCRCRLQPKMYSNIAALQASVWQIGCNKKACDAGAAHEEGEATRHSGSAQAPLFAAAIRDQRCSLSEDRY